MIGTGRPRGRRGAGRAGAAQRHRCRLPARRGGRPARQRRHRGPRPDRAGLAAGQKNLAGFDGARIGYDFAVAEECGRYDECQRYVDHFGVQVLMVEYRERHFAATCASYGPTHAVELRDLDLTPSGVHRWC